MKAVLAAKFVSGSPAAEALIQTCDTFLLEHNVKLGRDTFWSDNCDGEGRNFLGSILFKITHLNAKLYSRPSINASTR